MKQIDWLIKRSLFSLARNAKRNVLFNRVKSSLSFYSVNHWQTKHIAFSSLRRLQSQVP